MTLTRSSAVTGCPFLLEATTILPNRFFISSKPSARARTAMISLLTVMSNWACKRWMKDVNSLRFPLSNSYLCSILKTRQIITIVIKKKKKKEKNTDIQYTRNPKHCFQNTSFNLAILNWILFSAKLNKTYSFCHYYVSLLARTLVIHVRTHNTNKLYFWRLSSLTHLIIAEQYSKRQKAHQQKNQIL